VVGAAEQRADAVGRQFGVGGDEPLDALAGRIDRDRAAPAQALDRLAIDVGDEIAEAVDAQHDAADRIRGRLGQREVELLDFVDGPSQRGQLRALGEPRGGRGKAIAALERAAHGRPRVPTLGQFDDFLRRRLPQDHREHAVVGRHEPVVAGVGRESAARRADAGIDDGDEDRAHRKVPVGAGQLQRAGRHVVRRNLVADVDERRVGADAEDDPLHRAGVVIGGPEVRQQRDDGTHVTPAS
jgi:hypothetical protein